MRFLNRWRAWRNEGGVRSPGLIKVNRLRRLPSSGVRHIVFVQEAIMLVDSLRGGLACRCWPPAWPI